MTASSYGTDAVRLHLLTYQHHISVEGVGCRELLSGPLRAPTPNHGANNSTTSVAPSGGACRAPSRRTPQPNRVSTARLHTRTPILRSQSRCHARPAHETQRHPHLLNGLSTGSSGGAQYPHGSIPTPRRAQPRLAGPSTGEVDLPCATPG